MLRRDEERPVGSIGRREKKVGHERCPLEERASLCGGRELGVRMRGHGRLCCGMREGESVGDGVSVAPDAVMWKGGGPGEAAGIWARAAARRAIP